MKLEELFESKAETWTLYRGITGSLADAARAGLTIPLAHRGANYWMKRRGKEPLIKTLLAYGTDFEGGYGTEGGVLIQKQIPVRIEGDFAIFPPDFGVAHDMYDVYHEYGKVPKEHKDMYIVSRVPITNYKIVLDFADKEALQKAKATDKRKPLTPEQEAAIREKYAALARKQVEEYRRRNAIK